MHQLSMAFLHIHDRSVGLFNFRTNMTAPQDTIFARLCKLQTWVDFPGYGFSLFLLQKDQGHYIRDVEDQSPAFASGLRDDDIVIEVNGVNVGE